MPKTPHHVAPVRFKDLWAEGRTGSLGLLERGTISQRRKPRLRVAMHSLAQVTEPGLLASKSPWPHWEEKEKPVQPGVGWDMQVRKS